MRNGHVEWAPVCKGKLLDVATPRVGRATEYECTTLWALKKGRKGITTEIWIDGDSVGIKLIKGGTGVGTRRIADIATLGIENPEVVTGQGHEAGEGFNAGWPHGLKEGDVGFECGDHVMGGGDDFTTKCIDRCRTTAKMGRDTCRVRIKPYTQQAIMTLNVGCECIMETHGYPFSLQLFIDDVLSKVI
jgi:hypothetical protein